MSDICTSSGVCSCDFGYTGDDCGQCDTDFECKVLPDTDVTGCTYTYKDGTTGVSFKLKKGLILDGKNTF